MSDSTNTLGIKITTALAAVAAGWLVQKLIGTVWQRTTGGAAPTDLDDDALSITQAVAFAAVSGGLAVFARKAAQQGVPKAAAYMARPKV